MLNRESMYARYLLQPGYSFRYVLRMQRDHLFITYIVCSQDNNMKDQFEMSAAYNPT